jgi:GNAT superfamily N-acetyltransferase
LHDPRIEVYAFGVGVGVGVGGGVGASVGSVAGAASGARDEGLLELDFRRDGECEIVYFGVTREFIGTGAARFIMNRALERAWSHPIGRFWLHTCTLDHPRAVEFYVRTGFRPFKREVEIFDDPRVLGNLPRDAAPEIPIFD